MRKITLSKAVAFAAACFSSSVSYADGWPSWQPDTAFVPFAFSTESMGFSVGVAGVWKGAGQPQAALLGAGIVTDKDTWIGYLGGSNYTWWDNERWLLGFELYAGDFKQFDYYLGDASLNDSTPLDATKADAREELYRASLRYILPLGAGSQGVSAVLRQLRPVDGNTPWESGISTLELRPFYQSRQLRNLTDTEFAEAEQVWGLETRYEWDNRDNVAKPTNGSRTQFSISVDPGDSDRASWWKWTLNQSWYRDLGAVDNYAQEQVLAFNVYTGDTPSWNDTETVNGQTVFRRPPQYAGNNLGGLFRLRSYQTGRYSERSVMSYSAEYRVLPEWQPLGDWPIFNLYDVPWWQWVLFADLGRVADEYDLSELHSDMQYSVGGAIRFQVEGVVVRAETAWGDEDSIFRVMINQPF